MSEFIHEQVDLTGPLFKVDPGETMYANLKKVMAGIAAEGARVVQSDYLRGLSGRSPISEMPGKDRVAFHVIGRTQSRIGRSWSTAAVVQVYSEGFSATQGRSLNAAGSEVEGQTRGIASALRQLRSARALITADLTKGLD